MQNRTQRERERERGREREREREGEEAGRQRNRDRVKCVYSTNTRNAVVCSTHTFSELPADIPPACCSVLHIPKQDQGASRQAVCVCVCPKAIFPPPSAKYRTESLNNNPSNSVQLEPRATRVSD